MGVRKLTIDVLENSQLCCRLSSGQVQEVSEALDSMTCTSGDVVFHQHELGDSMFIVVKGRVKIEVMNVCGEIRLVEHLTVGEHFGEMAMLTGGQRAVTMTAVMDPGLLELKQDAFQKLLATVPGLAANVCRTLGFRLRRETSGRRPSSKPRVITLVNNSSRKVIDSVHL